MAMTLEPYAGDHIITFAEHLSARAAAEGQRYEGTFNGTLAYAEPGENAETVAWRWQRDFDAACKAYRNSPEGKKAAAEQQSRGAKNLQEALKLVSASRSVDFSDTATTLEFLERCVDPLGWTCTVHLCPIIYRRLERFGWIRNECVGDPAVKTDRGVFARWLAGQAMDGLGRCMGIHDSYHMFYQQWLNWVREEA
jgi:hypothetical protein